MDATQNTSCSTPGCDRPRKSRGLCMAHYARFKRTGSVGTTAIADARVQSLAERFWSKVNKDGPIIRPELGKCWIWTAATKDGGYGVMRPANQRTGPTVKAHRVSAELAGMDIKNRWVLHACDNPPCVNPAHLRPGEPVENAADMVARDRHNRGERVAGSKLTDPEIVEIRKLVDGGMLHRDVAEQFGVCRSTITRVVGRTGWKHVA